MTPTRKGLYIQCKDCIYKIKNSNIKYPCKFSHKDIRKSANIKYERDFKICVKYIKME